MPDSLTALVEQRRNLLEQLAGLGDFRSGSITPTRGKCGNPSCHCHRPQDPGHGPNFRLARKVAGKTVTETFPTAAAQRKAEREIAVFRKFQELSRALIEVNEKICRLRPVQEEDVSPQDPYGRGSATVFNGESTRPLVGRYELRSARFR